mmetsp:Transcript_15854/g.44442  ORF Transcript_15854/g.44442 Transcript_15854/m.44442 type:complete len:106 (-) Transcript_15854:122-439(-)
MLHWFECWMCTCCRVSYKINEPKQCQINSQRKNLVSVTPAHTDCGCGSLRDHQLMHSSALFPLLSLSEAALGDDSDDHHQGAIHRVRIVVAAANRTTFILRRHAA